MDRNGAYLGKLLFDDVLSDPTGSYDAASGVFVAPVDGIYFVYTELVLRNTVNGGENCEWGERRTMNGGE